jgi:hypothetical protein
MFEKGKKIEIILLTFQANEILLYAQNDKLAEINEDDKAVKAAHILDSLNGNSIEDWQQQKLMLPNSI